jgi:hypothetical protein
MVTGTTVEGAVRTARLVELTAAGTPLVELAGPPARVVPARTCVPIAPGDVGREVVIAFDAGAEEPVVLGVIAEPNAEAGVRVTADGRSVTLAAAECIVLECGGARLTLHRSGKIVIRGTHVVSHSSGVNRIRGGSVELN